MVEYVYRIPSNSRGDLSNEVHDQIRKALGNKTPKSWHVVGNCVMVTVNKKLEGMDEYLIE